MPATNKKFILLALYFLFLPFYWASAFEINYPPIAGGKITLTQNSSSLAAYFEYVFYFSLYVGFFSVFAAIVWAGVLYVLSPYKASSVAEAKERFWSAISGLVILLFYYLVIITLNPSLLKLGAQDLSKPSFENENSTPGIYFYKSNSCSTNEDYFWSVFKTADFGNRKDSIKSVMVKQGDDKGYVAILYNNINFKGGCQILNPEKYGSCQTLTPTAESASIHVFDPNPSGDGVYIYRKSSFNKDGGYLRIDPKQYKGSIYYAKLSEMDFSDGGSCTVQDEDQDCVQYYFNFCVKRSCPKLSANNIGSVEIKGDYIVVFTYFDDYQQNITDPLNYCQEFPVPDDVTKNGPQQTKWEPVFGTAAGYSPNYIMIIPVKNK